MRQCLCLLLAALVCLTVPPSALADGDSDAAAAEASQRFQRGVAMFREGAFRASLIEFERAYELKPHYRLLYNIGQAHFELGDYLEAIEALQAYLGEGGSEIEPSRRELVEQKLAGLRGRTALVSVSVNQAGAEIFIDDKLVGTSPLARSVSVNVGRHRVSVRSTDGATGSEVVDVAGGDIRELSFELEAQPVESTPAPTTAVALGPTAAGVNPADKLPATTYHKIAVGCLVGAGVLGVGSAIAIVLQRGDLKAYQDEVDKEGASPATVESMNTKARRGAIAVDVLGGLALASATAGLVVWWLDSDRDKPAKPNVGLGASGSQLLLQGTF